MRLVPADAARSGVAARGVRSDGTDETVAIDWAFSGIGPVGQDLHCMLTGSVWFYDVEPAQVEELDDAVFRGYLDGLRAAGWRGVPRVVRFGYIMSSALRYGLAPIAVAALDDVRRHAAILPRPRR